MSLMSLTAVELGRKIKEKEVTVEEAVTAALDAIEKREAQVHSFVTVDREGALKRAKEVQAKIDAGELTGPLWAALAIFSDCGCRCVASVRVSALDHESIDHAVEQQTIIITRKGQLRKILAMLWRLAVEFNLDSSHVGDDVENRFVWQIL